MKKLLYIFLSLFGILTYQTAFAICPVCTIAVGAGVGLSRWLGVDDTITGVWIGGITVSLIMWTLNWLQNKKINFKGKDIIVILAYYLIIILPLSWSEISGHPLNRLWGIDKLMLGIFLGSMAFLSGATWYEQIKKQNNGRAQFPFQKVAMPIAPLLILSLIFFLITR